MYSRRWGKYGKILISLKSSRETCPVINIIYKISYAVFSKVFLLCGLIMLYKNQAHIILRLGKEGGRGGEREEGRGREGGGMVSNFFLCYQSVPPGVREGIP
jgi:hypothetical protein